MTQYHVPYLSVEFTTDNLLALVKGMRAGVISGFEVSAGASGWTLDIASGWLRALDGTVIHDDLTRNDVNGLITRGAGNEHFAVWATYLATLTDPPAAVTFSTTKATPPALPSVPANSVRLADFFVPSAAASIADASIRFVNVPKVSIVGADGEALVDHLARAALTSSLFSAEPITYDDDTGDMEWTAPIIIQSLAIGRAQRYMQAPLVRFQAAANTVTVPGTAGARDAIIYAILDRTAPHTLASPGTATVKVLDLTATTPSAELVEIWNLDNLHKITVIAYVNGSRLFMGGGGGGGSIPAALGDELNVLFEGSSGPHWGRITQDMIIPAFTISTFNFTAAGASTPPGIVSGTNKPVIIGGLIDNPRFDVAFTPSAPNVPADVDDTLTLKEAAQVSADDVLGSDPVQSSLTSVGSGLTATGTPSSPAKKTFTLAAERGGVSTSSTRDIQFGNRIYWGVGVENPTINSAFVTGLAATLGGGGEPVNNSGNGTNEEVVITYAKSGGLGFTALDDDYVYFCYPDHWGTPHFQTPIGEDFFEDMGTTQVLKSGDPAIGTSGLGEVYRVLRSTFALSDAVSWTAIT